MRLTSEEETEIAERGGTEAHFVEYGSVVDSLVRKDGTANLMIQAKTPHLAMSRASLNPRTGLAHKYYSVRVRSQS